MVVACTYVSIYIYMCCSANWCEHASCMMYIHFVSNKDKAGKKKCDNLYMIMHTELVVFTSKSGNTLHNKPVGYIM